MNTLPTQDYLALLLLNSKLIDFSQTRSLIWVFHQSQASYLTPTHLSVSLSK
jgi:hypothetical protein